MVDENELYKKEVGAEGELSVSFENGMLIFKSTHSGSGGNVGLYLELNAAYVIDKITDVIPGDMDDNLLDGWAASFLAKKTT